MLHLGPGPEPARRLPEAAGHRRRGADPLRRPERRQRAGADRPDRGRHDPRLRAGRHRAARAGRSTPGLRSGRAGHGSRAGLRRARRPARRRASRRAARWSPTSTATASRRSSTRAGTHIYAWEPDGKPRARLPGLRRTSSFCGPAAREPAARHPKCGFLSSPAVGHLEGADEAARHRRARRSTATSTPSTATATPLPGLPGRARRPGRAGEPADDRRVDQRAGDRRPERRRHGRRRRRHQRDLRRASRGLGGDVRACRRCSPARPAAPRASTRSTARRGERSCPAGRSKLDGAIQDTLPLIGPGQDPAIAKIGGQTDDRRLDHRLGDDRGATTPAGNLVRSDPAGAPTAPGSDATDRSGTINLFESASLGKLLAGRRARHRQVRARRSADVANLLLVGQNVPYNHLIGAYDAHDRRAAAGLPADHRRLPVPLRLGHRQGRHGLGRPTRSSPAPGLGLLHAYDGATGLDVAGLPEGDRRLAVRPGGALRRRAHGRHHARGLPVRVEAPKLPTCQTEWPEFRHDPQQSGNYDRDGTPPVQADGPVGQAAATLRWKAPGDDYACGTARPLRDRHLDSPRSRRQNFAAATPPRRADAEAEAGRDDPDLHAAASTSATSRSAPSTRPATSAIRRASIPSPGASRQASARAAGMSASPPTRRMGWRSSARRASRPRRPAAAPPPSRPPKPTRPPRAPPSSSTRRSSFGSRPSGVKKLS